MEKLNMQTTDVVDENIKREPGGLVPVSHKVSFHVMSPAKSKSLYAPTANGNA